MIRVLVIGSGQRVREAALPALLSRPEAFTLAGVRSRKAKTIETVAPTADGGTAARTVEVDALDADGGLAAAVEHADLVYVCVAKGAVPGVLARLADATRGTGHPHDLLIDTPVLLFKHLAARRHFGAFARVWVAEDMWTLPWVETVTCARDELGLGAPRHLVLDRSAYAYHGLALAKTLLDDWRLTRVRRRSTGVVPPGEDKAGEPAFERDLVFAGGGTCHVTEPRDYGLGRFRLECAGGTLVDRASTGEGHVLEPLVEPVGEGGGLRWTGFRIGAVETRLAPHEVTLLGELAPREDDGVIARMDALKRVGFARLFDRIAAGEGAYPLEEGLDDMWVDYALEKLGRWRATPLTSVRSGLARGLFGGLTGLAGKLKG